MDWAISPNLKRRPHTPQDVIRFPWEKVEQAEIENAEPLTEEEIKKLSEIFNIDRNNIINHG